jgi:superfamily II DNA or RNA helicase
MELTERLLIDAGGWQVMKHARGLHSAGRVSEASWSGEVLGGYVREGETRYRSGLRVISKSNIENLCTCRDSKLRGTICAHSIAVGLEVLNPAAVPSRAGEAPPAAPSASMRPHAEMQKPGVKGFSTDSGVPVELHVVFPPNLVQAAGRSGASVGIEAVAQGRRVLLHALDSKQTYHCGASDMRLLEALAGIQPQGALSGMLMLQTEPLLTLFEALAGHPRVSVARRSTLSVDSVSLAPVLSLRTLSNGDLALGAQLPTGGALMPGKKAAWFLREGSLRQVCAGLPPAYMGLLLGEVLIPAAGVADFLKREWPALSLRFDCSAVTLPSVGSVHASERAASGGGAAMVSVAAAAFELELEGSLQFLSARLHVSYGDFRTTLGQPGGQGRPVDREAEAEAVERLLKAGFSRADAGGAMTLRGEQAVLEFFARHLPALQREWRVQVGERFQHVTRNIERIEPRLQVVGSGGNWFEMDVALETQGGERFAGAEIRRLIQSGRSHLKRKDGSVAVFDPALLDEFDEVLRDCAPDQPRPGLYRISNRQAGFVQAFAEQSGASLQAPAQWGQWAAATRKASSLKPIPLGALDALLRPYQKQGVYWMHFLAENGFCGILADEMGLGKTVQALAFMGTLRGRCLVVAPSSLLINWQREAERFLPQKRVLVLSGPDRHAREWAQADILITSYPLLRLDSARFAGEQFDAVVLDEAQHIKNPESQAAQAAFRLRADRRFVLTGTPVENSVRDVWSLMHFLMPGYLGTRADFKERYEQPVAEDPGGPEHRRMVQRLSPFLLRRTKKAVAPELPDKIEQVVWCELSPVQREAYAKLVDMSRREVGKADELKNKSKARMLMLTALLRLRQACNDLRLLGEDFLTQDDSASGKLDALGELVSEALEGGHRLLLFSQFSSMLDLLQRWLEARQIEFCRLDGSTRDRTAQVDRFQTGGVPVFLISLKAGGVGLTLTAADTVVHFDPWWNPAVEAQATDRAHRIGQKSVVTSYKFITRGTVEEKILQLQDRKKSLMDALVESEHPMMEGLSMDDIAGLLDL